VSTEFLNISALMTALLLLYLCVLVFTMSNQYQWLYAHRKRLLWAFGMVPGLIGVGWGLWLYLVSGKPQLITPAFLLLEFGTYALLRAESKHERT